MSQFLLCYDIRDKRRLARVHRIAVRYALPLQYSVFYLKGSRAQLDKLLAELDNVTEAAEDDVRVYEVQPLEQGCMLGKSVMPDGVWLSGVPRSSWQ